MNISVSLKNSSIVGQPESITRKTNSIAQKRDSSSNPESLPLEDS
jgi:hypothetical protein